MNFEIGPGLCSAVFRTCDLLATERSHYQLSYLGPPEEEEEEEGEGEEEEEEEEEDEEEEDEDEEEEERFSLVIYVDNF
ncbi:hypothetical protein ElyMa_003338900 [Elysia marginata]|uniref:Uncharacterized protein n=1 Tax=Elysia marginata TaxID=1093978 RepID=A0AAV4JGQ7_9GAST|nr:hypothetical protein ElyMa_003338900 [Elysia marginata]